LKSTNRLLVEFYSRLSPRRKIQLLCFSAFCFVAATFELLTLLAIVPFISILTGNRLFAEKILAFVSSSSFRINLDLNSLLFIFALCFGILSLITAALRILGLRAGSLLGAGMLTDLASKAYEKVLLQPYSFHVNANSANIINSFTNQLTFASLAIDSFIRAFTSAVVALLLSVGLIIVNPTASVLVTLFFGIIYLGIFLKARKILGFNSVQIDANRQVIIKTLNESLGGIRDLIIMGSYDHFTEKFSVNERLHRRLFANNEFIASSPRFILEGLGLFSISVLSIAFVTLSGSPSELLALLGSFAFGYLRLLPSVQQVFAGWSALSSANSELSGMMDLLDLQIPTSSLECTDFQFTGSIRFDTVSFKYAGESSNTLCEINAEIMCGERLAIVGATGSGKSTFVDMLMGLLCPTAGQILVDGKLLADNHGSPLGKQWRSMIAHVPQSIFLSDSSILQNIAFGIPEDQIDHDLVRFVAKQAQISSFIESAPLGFDQIIGERGVKLSGGQRQRLGIARALYRQPKILVLDEATSALDGQTEMNVLDAINNLDRNITIIMIAHRLSTVKKFDRVLRLEKGCVVEDGPPSKVLPEN